jgi:hypothetical protein
MKRRKFVAASLLGATAMTTGFAASIAKDNPLKKQLFEFREYQSRFGTNAADLDNYLQGALIPAMNKYGVSTVGVFRETGKSEPAKLYLLIPYPSWDVYLDIRTKVNLDTDYIKASTQYHATVPEKVPFSRIDTSLLLAFDRLPALVVPAKEPRIFELRTYEGHNEDAVQRKVTMFNKEEIDLFYKVGLKPVFFGEMLAGSKVPCLTYLLSFKDMEEREDIWAKFGAHPDWNTMSQLPQYANTVSNIVRIFLEPVAYSQV